MSWVSPGTTPARELRAVGYLRVSTDDQRYDMQLDEIREFTERRGWELTRTYLDEGVSGVQTSRPALDELLAAARRRRFDVVVVWRADRLARSLRHLVNTLADLDALGVHFASVTEPFDSTTPSGRLLFNLVGSFAEFERDLIRERTRAGLATARRRGVQLGRPRAVFDLERALDLRAEGWSHARIGKELGVGASTIRRALAATRAADAAE